MSEGNYNHTTHYSLIIGVGWRSAIYEQSTGDDAWMHSDRMPVEHVDFSVLCNLPALVMPEVEHGVPTKARLTRISNIREQNQGYRNPGFAFGYQHLSEEFTAEELIPEILSGNRFIGHRTQWHIWEGDIIGRLVSLLRKQGTNDKPTFFGLQDWPLPNLGHVAVMMPYSDGFDSTYLAITDACSKTGRLPLRVKEVLSRQPIVADIFSTIVQSSVVICDITGLNVNVLYEAGIAHARNVPVILITQDTGNPPFNLSQTQVVHYVPNEQGLRKLRENLVSRINFFAD